MGELCPCELLGKSSLGRCAGASFRAQAHADVVPVRVFGLKLTRALCR